MNRREMLKKSGIAAGAAIGTSAVSTTALAASADFHSGEIKTYGTFTKGDSRSLRLNLLIHENLPLDYRDNLKAQLDGFAGYLSGDRYAVEEPYAGESPFDGVQTIFQLHSEDFGGEVTYKKGQSILDNNGVGDWDGIYMWELPDTASTDQAIIGSDVRYSDESHPCMWQGSNYNYEYQDRPQTFSSPSDNDATSSGSHDMSYRHSFRQAAITLVRTNTSATLWDAGMTAPGETRTDTGDVKELATMKHQFLGYYQSLLGTWYSLEESQTAGECANNEPEQYDEAVIADPSVCTLRAIDDTVTWFEDMYNL